METIRNTGSCCSELSSQPIALAMVYAPMQRWQNLYDPDLALERGTLFAELDKPFLGKDAVITNER